VNKDIHYNLQPRDLQYLRGFNGDQTLHCPCLYILQAEPPDCLNVTNGSTRTLYVLKPYCLLGSSVERKSH